MASNKNKLVFLLMPAPASYVAGFGRGASGFMTRSDTGPAREGPSAEVIAEAQARHGKEPKINPEQFKDPDNEYGLLSGTTYEQDDEEADKIYHNVDRKMDSWRRARRGVLSGWEARENTELAKHRAEHPKIQQQFADLKCGLKKQRKDERTFVISDSIIVGDRDKSEYENSLDTQQQQANGFETPADSSTVTNFVEIGQAHDKVLSLKLDQISGTSTSSASATVANAVQHVGQSVNIWLAAADHEQDVGSKKCVLHKALENIPNSVQLWNETVKLKESATDARILLSLAMEVIPPSVELWLALACLETPETPSICYDPPWREPSGGSPLPNPSPLQAYSYEFEHHAPSGDLLNPWDHTPTVRHPNGRPGELGSCSRTQSAYEPVPPTISFPEPELHRFASQRTTLHPHSPRHRPSKSDDGHGSLPPSRDYVDSAPFTPVTPDSASSMHYLPEDDWEAPVNQLTRELSNVFLHSEEGLRQFRADRLAEKDEEWHRLVPPEAQEALGKKEVKRQSVLFELFKSERDYVEDLKLVTEVFIEPLKFANPPVIAPDKLRAFVLEVFWNLGQITVHHEHMLATLFERQLDQHPLAQSVTDIFQSEYESYIKHYPFAEERHRTELSRNKSYQVFMQKCSQDPRVRKRDMITFLSRPVTRLPRLHLILEHIQKITEPGHPDLEDLPLLLSITLWLKIPGDCSPVLERGRSRPTVDPSADRMTRAKSWMLSTDSEVVYNIARRRKSSGLCWPKRSGWLATCRRCTRFSKGAFIANPESEQIWLAAVKLEAENGELGIATELLVRAQTVADTEWIWMKSAIFEHQQGQYAAALETVSAAVSKFPEFAKLYMIQGQIGQMQRNYSIARASAEISDQFREDLSSNDDAYILDDCFH
ncbi:hypothetical protein EV702DRAFT_1246578 [Suillus placidus]|uniref:DH domain-containing protein n=1 Tax=Suillus placidus TaxID=48579 RepID=A0A9P6ZM90_9AGAM|nr:hypothetical protein EV702DRAFT_1246578 [Suillus placidus]